MKKTPIEYALADKRSCWKLFGGDSPLVMKRTSCRIVAANFVARKCGIVLPDRVEVVNFDLDQTGKVDTLQKRFGHALSLDDAASLFIAKEEKLVLITDDRAIRRCAKELNIQTIDCDTFATQATEFDAYDLPPSKLTEDRMKKIKGKEVPDLHQSRNRKLKNDNYE